MHINIIGQYAAVFVATESTLVVAETCVGNIYSSECVAQNPCGHAFSKCFCNIFSRIFKSSLLQC